MHATTNSRELRIVMGGAKDDVQLGHDPVRNGGPYHAVAFEPERSMQLEASLTHWASRPRLERITITVDADLDAQAAVLQTTDAARARQLLDSAGWTMGADGVRRKDEDRLTFTMFTPTGEALAMAALARAVKRQLAPLGYDIRVEHVAALSMAIKGGAYTAALRTSYAQLTGDPFFWLKLWLARGGRVNQGPTYDNQALEDALDRYSRAIASEDRHSRWQDIEAILKADVPHIFLVWAPLIVVARADRVRGFELDPNNEYFVDGSLAAA